VFNGEEFQVNFNAAGVRNLEQVLSNIESQQELLVDARPAARFNGEAPEPRPGLTSGHVPKSLNIPFDQIMSAGLGSKVKTTEQLDALFKETLGEDQWKRPMIMSCGSGMTAAVVMFGAYLAGKELSEMSLYDGSWSEYGKPELNLPFDTKKK
jgi:thiosulfate/3-mercaptopyruvate sulfurtransferase